MNKYEKVINILEKETISAAEEQYLDQKSNEDIEVRNFIDIYVKLEQIFEYSTHLDLEILAEFILYYDGDLEVAKYTPRITDRIEEHLTNCSICNNEYIAFNKEYQLINEFVTRSITDDEKNIQYDKQSSIFSRIKNVNFRTPITAIILLFITYAGMMLTSNYTAVAYKENIFEFNEQYSSLAQERDSELFGKCITALDLSEFETANGYLIEDIIIHSRDSSIFLSYYLLGISYLKSSEYNILGTFTSFDHIRVNKGIENLLISIQKNSSEKYERLNIDARYFIAKGYLAIDEIDLAKKNLQIVVDLRGKYYADAVKILKSIEKVK
jgi:hypothetical protein